MLRPGLPFLLALVTTPAFAAVTGPYVADTETVHLFHLDEAVDATNAANSGSSAAGLLPYSGSAVPAAATAAQPANTTILGATTYSAAFGRAASIATSTVGLGLDANQSGGFQPGTTTSPDAIAQGSIAGADGSFTLEALVNLPSITGASREIISTDSSMSNRGFQFRIGTTGALEFNFITGSGSAISAAIPTTGPHRFAANEWFHVALSFDGSTNTSTFYWTKLAPSSAQANAIGSSTSENTVASVTGPLVIGNEARGASGEGLQGLIDEVRISKVVRSASAFLFANDDLDGDGLSDAWEALHFGNLGQDGNGDPDGDGYDNMAEFVAGTAPDNPDSNPGDADLDGLQDEWEIHHFGNLTAQDGEGDPDGDFASNSLEEAAHSSPVNPIDWPETDGDQLNDGWELFYFGNLSRDGSADSDGDGAGDKAEHDATTDPTQAGWSPSRSLLAHRWSFNGNLEDSVGTEHAELIDPDSNPATGAAALGDSNVLLQGGVRSEASYIELGNNLLGGRKTPLSIELWATQIATRNWGRIFDFGSSTTEYLFMSWTQGTTLANDQVRWLDGVSSLTNNSNAPYVLGTPYHIVLTIEPRAGSAGSTRVTWYAAPAAAATLGGARGSFETTNTPLDFNDAVNWLGRSMFAADATANARYDECRIWNGALGAEEREHLHVFGPDSVSYADSDADGLPDAWEIGRFGDLDETANSDTDGDGYSNGAEFAAGSHPAVTASIPGDIDGDDLPDQEEMRYFGNLSATASGDPDGDGESTATELTNNSAPNNRASLSTDTDGDGLPDPWELSHFSHLGHNGGADPDKDGFGNLQEWEAGTNPADAESRPAGTAVRLVPLDDGDHATSEFGYGGASAINTVSFVRSSLKTVGNQQFVTWYGRHQFDANAKFNNTIWIGRRALGSSEWEVFRHPTFTANTITDGHDVISYGIDGDGYMHVSWGMHGDAFHYSRSVAPVTGTAPIVLGPDSTMTGREDTVTYPQFLKLPDGDLLFLFREVASGNGDTFLNRYDTATKTWDNVHRSGNIQLPFIKGTGWTPNYNAYPNMPQLGGPDGDDLLLTWCWRYEPVGGDSPANENGYQTNNQFAFGRSTDAGLTWQHHDGTAYTLPISRDGESGDPATKAEQIMAIPEGSSLINQASSCLDANGNPVIASWWAPETAAGNYRRQYMVVFRDDNGVWQKRPVSNRTIDPTGTKYDENFVRNLGRPTVVHDDSGRIIVAYRDNQGSNGITIVHSLPKAEDPERLVWIEFDLTTENLGNYETIIDNELWDRDRQLHFLYQAATGEGYTTSANTASRFSILEWDAKTYFAHKPQPQVSLNGGQVQIRCISEPSWSYRLWSSSDLTDWQLEETREGTGTPIQFTAPLDPQGSRRFWRIEYVEGG
ncbi:BNR-4 repeat-containing protein [Luteolibacter luteus]|uniref:LamG-like jellyroll fold domain-containing protein n=1 Tax=Luteolibacter luteus TaxID=2728835 RepID=A0A858RPH7_9BACT|nr:BNR-4 repeat-containing protein [Luteolibacter luteus]QJE98521.1 hypothetical protein HHL09_22945 [Luteolibacter luteus]